MPIGSCCDINLTVRSPLTDGMMSLRALIEKAPGADLLREMIGVAAQRLMELEVGELTGAAYGEKDPERLAQRNGYRSRDWQTRAGTVELVGSGAPDPQAPQGILLPGLSQASARGGEGAHRGDPGLSRAADRRDRWRLDPVGR